MDAAKVAELVARIRTRALTAVSQAYLRHQAAEDKTDALRDLECAVIDSGRLLEIAEAWERQAGRM